MDDSELKQLLVMAAATVAGGAIGNKLSSTHKVIGTLAGAFIGGVTGALLAEKVVELTERKYGRQLSSGEHARLMRLIEAAKVEE